MASANQWRESTADGAPQDPFARLGKDVCAHVLSFLNVEEVATLTRVNKLWASLIRREDVWLGLLQRDYSDAVLAVAGASKCDWRLQYRKAMALASLQKVRWCRKRQTSDKCPSREGHAVCTLDRDTMLLFGGFGQTQDLEYIVYDDVYLLRVNGSDCHWEQPALHGTPPPGRYGHTIVRCGRKHDLLVVLGGMTVCGYFGETNTVVVLAPPDVASTIPAHDTGAAPAAAGAGAAPTPFVARRPGGVELAWVYPQVRGSELMAARGYHSAAVSKDGVHVYVFGGIGRRQSRGDMCVLDTDTWSWSVPVTTGEAPPLRFGHSSVVWGGRLWVFGGGWGFDLLRSGGDHGDVFCLDLATMAWSRCTELEDCPQPDVLGRCHSSVLVGSKVLFFGGSLDMSNDLCWLDLARREWAVPGAPRVLGERPLGRFSHSLALLGERAYLFGGWMPGCHELGDLYSLSLVTFDDVAWRELVDEMIDDVDEYSECTLPTCPCQKMLLRRRSASRAVPGAGSGGRMRYAGSSRLYRSSPAPPLQATSLSGGPGGGLWTHDTRGGPMHAPGGGLWRVNSRTDGGGRGSLDAALASLVADMADAREEVIAAAPSSSGPRLWSARSSRGVAAMVVGGDGADEEVEAVQVAPAALWPSTMRPWRTTTK